MQAHTIWGYSNFIFKLHVLSFEIIVSLTCPTSHFEKLKFHSLSDHCSCTIFLWRITATLNNENDVPRFQDAEAQSWWLYFHFAIYRSSLRLFLLWYKSKQPCSAKLCSGSMLLCSKSPNISWLEFVFLRQCTLSCIYLFSCFLITYAT